METVKADPLKNRLYIDLKGVLEVDAVKAVAIKIIEETKKLRSGFDVIDSLLECEFSSDEARLEMMPAMTFLKEYGVNRVIRVIENITSYICISQLEQTSSLVGYETELAYSVREAEEMLDRQIRRTLDHI